MERNRNDRGYGRDDFQSEDTRHRGSEQGRTGQGSRRDAFGGGDYGSQDSYMGDERRNHGERGNFGGDYGSPRGGMGDYGGGYGQGSFGGQLGSQGRGDYGGGSFGSGSQSGFGQSGYGQSYGGSYGQGSYGNSGSSGNASGRSYGGGERGNSQGGRGFWDKAADEVSSWFGDRGAEHRRDMDEHRGRGPKGYSRSDERIKEDVNDRLTEDGMLDASNVSVEVKDREVTLSGTVSDRGSKRRAEDVAESVSGVSHVQNNLRVQMSGGTTDIDVDRSSTTGLVAKSGAGGQR